MAKTIQVQSIKNNYKGSWIRFEVRTSLKEIAKLWLFHVKCLYDSVHLLASDALIRKAQIHQGTANTTQRIPLSEPHFAKDGSLKMNVEEKKRVTPRLILVILVARSKIQLCQ